MRRGGGCGILSMAAITFENDAQIVLFKAVVFILYLIQMFRRSHVTLAIIMKLLTRCLPHLRTGLHTTHVTSNPLEKKYIPGG